MGRKYLSQRALVSITTLAMTAAFIFLSSSQQSRQRLGEFMGVVTKSAAAVSGGKNARVGLAEDFRAKVYRDTLGIIYEAPVAGVGYGSFRYVFPQYRKEALNERECLHPESDWMRLAAEGGVLGLVAYLAAGVWLFVLIFKHKGRPSWPVRLGFATALILLFAHGLIDVPLHRAGLAWLAIFLAAGAIRRSPKPGPSPVVPSWQSRGFKIAGGVFSVVGAGMVLLPAAFAPGSVVVRTLDRSELLIAAGDMEGARLEVDHGLTLNPLASILHYQRGRLALLAGPDLAKARREFAIQRFLDPLWTDVPLRQARAFKPFESGDAVSLIQDAMQRAERLGAAGDITSVQILRGALGEFRDSREVVVGLEMFAATRPDWRMEWLAGVPQDVKRPALQRIISGDMLGKFNDEDRQRLIAMAYENLDPEQIAKMIEADPAWLRLGWRVLASKYAKSGQYQQAVKLAATHGDLSLELGEASDLRGIDYLEYLFTQRPTDAVVVRALVTKLLADKNTVAAERVLQQAVSVERPNRECFLLQASYFSSKEDWKSAWQALSRYLGI